MRRIILSMSLAVLMVGICALSPVEATLQSGTDLTQMLPDGNAVILVDFQRVSSSPLWPILSEREPVKGLVGGAQSEIAEIGVRSSDLHSVAIVFNSGFKNPTVAVRGNLDPTTVLSQIRANPKLKLTSEKYKGVDIHQVAREARGPRGQSITQQTAFAFLSPGIVILGTAEGVRAAVDVRDGQRPPISQNSKLNPLISKNQTTAIQFAIAMVPEMTRSLQTSNLPLPDFSTISLVFGTVDITSAIDLDVTLRSDNVDHATAIANQLNSLMNMAVGFLGAGGDPKSEAAVGLLKSIAIAGSDIDVRITGNLPSELLAQVIK